MKIISSLLMCLILSITVQAKTTNLQTVELSEVWQVITFPEFSNPIVIAGIATNNDVEPAVVKIKNVTSTSAEVAIKAWDYQKAQGQNHGMEQVSFLVIEAGRYVLEDGTVIEANKEVGVKYSANINFTEPFLQTPWVFTSAQTSNGLQASSYSNYSVTRHNFLIGQRQQSENWTQETSWIYEYSLQDIGYLAISSPVKSFTFDELDILLNEAPVDHNWTEVLSGRFEVKYSDELSFSTTNYRYQTISHFMMANDGLFGNDISRPDAIGTSLRMKNGTVNLVPSSSCLALFQSGFTINGEYELYIDTPAGQVVQRAYCDMENGGWTLVLRAYSTNRVSEYLSAGANAINELAAMSPYMNETFKLSDELINKISANGTSKLKVVSDETGVARYTTGVYCHNTGANCNGYLGTWSDEALLTGYAKGVNGNYENIRGGISSDAYVSQTPNFWLYSFQSYKSVGWMMGDNFLNGRKFCYGTQANCHFTIWAK